jgi:hypothetical protein
MMFFVRRIILLAVIFCLLEIGLTQRGIQSQAQQTLVAWSSGTTCGAVGTGATQTILPPGATNIAAVTLQLDQTSTITAGAMTLEGSYDATVASPNWVNLPAANVINPTSSTLAQSSNPYTFVASTQQPFLILTGGFTQIRMRCSTTITGTGSITPTITPLSFSVMEQQLLAQLVTAVNGNIPGPFGQTTMSASLPVVIASNQTALPASVTTWGTGTLGAMANYGTSPGTVLVPGVNAFVTNTLSANPGTASLWNTSWAGGTLGSMANYGTSPGAVLVPGVNAFITNKVLVTPDSVALPANQTVNVALFNGVTPLMNNGVSGTGSPRVNIASDNSAVAGLGVAATAAAVPANAVYGGANVGGNLTGSIKCGSSAFYDASTSGSTQLVAISGSTKIYICGYTIFAGATANVGLVYGTGTNCATGSTKITPAYPLVAQAGAVDGAAEFRGLATVASQALCINSSAAVAVQATVYYTQF